MNERSELRLTVDLGVNFSLDLVIPLTASELSNADKVNRLISECLKLEMPAPTKAKKINSVPQISDYLRSEIARIFEDLNWQDNLRVVQSDLVARRPPVKLTVTGYLNETSTKCSDLVGHN